MSSQPRDWREKRLEKLEALASIGLPYHPTTFARSHSASDLVSAFDQMVGQEVAAAGRLVAVNHMGKAAFLRIQDASGRIQGHITRNTVPEPLWDYYRLLDLGDLIGATGTLFKTRTGEITIEIRNLVLLQKSYHPPPEKFHGLSDVEARFRHRYIDLIANEESRVMAQARSRMTAALRRFLDDRGFLEVETPILQPIYGGGAAEPFRTHVDAFDMDVYLRIADELYLKRLIVGGLERVYEIGKDFRNEGFSRKHSQEFTQLELYQAYADYHDMMRILEEMIVYSAGQITGGNELTIADEVIDLTPPWARVTFKTAMRDHAGLDLDDIRERESLLSFAREQAVVVSPEMSRGALLDQIWSSLVEPNLIQPTFVTDYPVDFPGSTFARGSRTNPDEVERFEAFVGGIELANAFTEMNDPFEQEARLKMLAETVGTSEDPAERDADFLLALEYGMPPTGGLGLGLDRLAMVLTGAEHIRETILFPLLRKPAESDA